MKSIALNAVLAATAVQGYLIPPKTKNIDWKLEQKRQIIGTITTLLGNSNRRDGRMKLLILNRKGRKGR